MNVGFVRCFFVMLVCMRSANIKPMTNPSTTILLVLKKSRAIPAVVMVNGLKMFARRKCLWVWRMALNTLVMA